MFERAFQLVDAIGERGLSLDPRALGFRERGSRVVEGVLELGGAFAREAEFLVGRVERIFESRHLSVERVCGFFTVAFHAQSSARGVPRGGNLRQLRLERHHLGAEDVFALGGVFRRHLEHGLRQFELRLQVGDLRLGGGGLFAKASLDNLDAS